MVMSVTLHWVGAQTISTVETICVRVYNINECLCNRFPVNFEPPMFRVRLTNKLFAGFLDNLIRQTASLRFRHVGPSKPRCGIDLLFSSQNGT